MTNFTKNLTIAATALLVAAGCASAQTMKADIPFSFRVGEKVMPAGLYHVTNLNGFSGNKVFRIDNSSDAVVAVAHAAADAERSWKAAGKPVLSFECTASRCSLDRVYTGYDSQAYAIPHARPGRNEAVRVATVALHSEKAD